MGSGGKLLQVFCDAWERDYLNFGVVGTGDQLRGFLNSVQIVTVPEPSVGVLLLGGLGVLAVRRRR